MTAEPYLITAITSLVGGIVWLAFYIKGLHAKHYEDQKENLEKMTGAMVTMTEAMIGNKIVIEQNSKITKEVEGLLHTVNSNILELKFKK